MYFSYCILPLESSLHHEAPQSKAMIFSWMMWLVILFSTGSGISSLYGILIIIHFLLQIGTITLAFQKISWKLQHAQAFDLQKVKDETKCQLYSLSWSRLSFSFGLANNLKIFFKKQIYFTKRSFWALEGLKAITNAVWNDLWRLINGCEKQFHANYFLPESTEIFLMMKTAAISSFNCQLKAEWLAYWQDVIENSFRKNPLSWFLFPSRCF